MKPTHIEIQNLQGDTLTIPKQGMILNKEGVEFYIDYTTGSNVIFISKETYEKVRHELLKEI